MSGSYAPFNAIKNTGPLTSLNPQRKPKPGAVCAGERRIRDNFTSYMVAKSLISEFDDKDTSKVNNVFLSGWKFYQKTVFSSSYRLLIIPSEAMVYTNDGHSILLGDNLSRTLCGCSSVALDKILIHNLLILHFNLVSYQRHI